MAVGEFADYALDELMDTDEMFERAMLDPELADDLRFAYGHDEAGYSNPVFRREPSPKTCRYCGATDLHWEQVNGQWRLFGATGMHVCQPE
jgi:hypothetical protein